MPNYPIIEVYPFPEKETQIIHAIFEDGETATLTYREFERITEDIEVHENYQDMLDILRAIARDYMEQG